MKLTGNRLAVTLAAAGFLFISAASAQTQLPPPAFGQADARQDRVEELEGQLRGATAENERLQYELLQAQREVARLRGIVGDLAGVNQSLAEGQSQQGSVDGAAAGASAPNANLNPPPPTAGGQQRSANPPPAQTGSLGTLPASPSDAAATYSRGREMLVNGRYAEAEVAFRDFLQQNPQADTAADARYWLGFTLLARNDYQNAAATFVEYLQRTPNGPRAPEAQVRLGMALVGMDQKAQGCSAFAALPSRYPNAARAVRDLAAREARAAACG